MRHCNYALRGVHYGILLIFYLYLRRLQFQEHHDISVTGYGDILLERFEESPSLPAGLPRHLSQLVMATFSLSSTYGVGYGYSGPVRLEDYIFGIRFLDITGYGDIGPVRFEEYIFIPISVSSPTSTPSPSAGAL